MLAASCIVSLAAAFQVSPSSPYMGQPVPGMTPALFAPGIVRTDAIELNGVFTPDTREFFFARRTGGEPTIFHARLAGWTRSSSNSSESDRGPRTPSHLNVDFGIRT
jgi:hypothetical protein